MELPCQSGILTCDMRPARDCCARASGQAPWRQEPSSGLSPQKAQVHLLAGNQDNAGQRLHFCHLRSQSHHILLYQPCEQQLHFQFCNPSAQAGPNPIAKGHGAEWVLDPGVFSPFIPQPSVRLEALRLRKGTGIPGCHIVAQHKLGLRRKNGSVSISKCNRHSWATGSSRPTHILGEKEAIEFNVLFRDDTGV